MTTDEEASLFQAKISSLEDEIASIDRKIQKLQSEKKKHVDERDKLLVSAQRLKVEKIASKDWQRTDFSWSTKMMNKLESVFKIKSFRGLQLQTINAIMSGHDVTLIMPTGGGKSLCYQLPALLLPGFSLVVSPLVSLMEDQIMALKKLSYPAEMLSASADRKAVNEVMGAMTNPKAPLKLLLVTPEKLGKSKRFISKLQKAYEMGRFSLMAVDEVHCCSQWGHDFRRDYQFLGVMRGMFPKTPFLGLTATGTGKVIDDVHQVLNVSSTAVVFRDSFNRPNLIYEVVRKPSAQKDCVAMIKDLLQKDFKEESGIIYTFSIKDAEEIAESLNQSNLKVGVYHANLDPKIRSSVHSAWVNNKIRVIVATIAFGMGIDKPDVRFVIHHSLSKSIENYYQESGRAGRDGKRARCILMHRFGDDFRVASMVCGERTGITNLKNIMAYAVELSRCRRQILAQYFEAEWNSTDCDKACDNCLAPTKAKEVDVTALLLKLYQIFDETAAKDQKLTGLKLVEALGKAKSLSPEYCERVITSLLLEGYLKMDFHYTPYNVVVYVLPDGSRRLLIKKGTGKVTMLVSGGDSVAGSSERKRKLKDSCDVPKKKVPTVVLDD